MAHAGTVQTEVLIAGAGPAGLAVAACLRRRSVPFQVLEAAPQLGGTWRQNYDRLQTNTSRRHSGLPFRPLPRGYPTFPSRQQVQDYLIDYAAHFGVDPRFEQPVEAAWHDKTGNIRRRWTVTTPAARYHARTLVIATGMAGRANIPEIEGLDEFPGDVVHSHAYRNGAPFAGKKVLVLGCGSSGGEIALDLHERGATPFFVVRSPMHVVPRELMGRPTHEAYILFERLPPKLRDAVLVPVYDRAVGDLSRFGIVRPRVGPCQDACDRGRIPLVDNGVVELIRSGRLPVYPGVRRFDGGRAVFVDGRALAVDAVVLATGYKPAVRRFLVDAEFVTDDRGVPLVNGRESSIPGLFFIGFAPRPSGSLREIRRDAVRMADAIS